MENRKQKFWYEEEKIIETKNFEGASLLDYILQFLRIGIIPELSQINNLKSFGYRFRSC